MRKKHIQKIREFFRKTPVVDIKSIKLIVGNDDYTYLLINHMLKRNEIKRITKGYYTIYDDPSLIVYCFKPAYIALEDAMSFHNLWEQETNVVLVTPKKIRTGVRKVLGSNVLIRMISPKYFFGYEYFKYGDFILPVSNIEKTFIDMVYFKEIESRTVKEFKKKIDIKKLNSYLKKYPKIFRKKVLGMI